MEREINLTVREAVHACDGIFYGDDTLLDKRLTTVVIDSRKAVRGSLFVAIKGENTDGFEYISSATEKGALCAVSEKRCEAEPCIVVPDSVAALQRIAAYYRSKLNITVIGITGSVGKTTTKEVVASVLSMHYNVTKTEGNFNNGLGLPLSILSIKPETDVAVIEMGMNHFGEMSLLTSIARPTMCIMTNIGISHIENFGTRENILKAKSEIFECMPPAARCILNGDDDLLSAINRPNKCFFGFEQKNDIYIESFLEKGFSGTEFSVSLFGEHFDCTIPLPGRHVLFAAMAAMAAGSWLGLTHEQIVDGLLAAKAMSGRANVIKTDTCTIIDDCYNAAPNSVESGIDLLVKSDARRSVCILGDMGELGRDAAALHRGVGEHAATERVGLVIAIGPLSKNTYSACIEKGGNAVYFEKMDDFLKKMNELIKKGDTVLIKASHYMHFEKIVEALKNRNAEQQN